MKNVQNDLDKTDIKKDVDSQDKEVEFEEFIVTKEEFEKYQELMGPMEEFIEGETQI